MENIKKLYLTLAVGLLTLPAFSFAADAPTIKGMVDASVKTAFYIAGGIVVILWLVTGVLFLTAQGDPGKLGSAKKALIAAVAGTIICIVAGGAVSLVGSAIGL